MRISATFLSVLLLAGGVSACSDQAQQETEEAGEAVGSDIERGLNDAATEADQAGDKAEAEANRLGDKIENAADDAADATGKALENAGRELRD